MDFFSNNLPTSENAKPSELQMLTPIAKTETGAGANTDAEIEAVISGVTTLLKNGKAKIDAVLNTAVDTIITISHRGIVTDFNPAAEKMFGYKPEEIIGQNIKILMPQPHQDNHDGYLDNYMKTNVRKVIGIGREVMGRHKDGTLFDIDLSVAELELNGEKYFTGIIRDISERKKQEKINKQLASIVESSNEAMIGTDPKLNINTWNKSAQQTFGYTPEEALGENVSLLFEPQEFNHHFDLFNKCIEESKIFSQHEAIGISKEGRRIDLSMSIAPLHNSVNLPNNVNQTTQVSGISIIANDITETKEIERNLAVSRALAKNTLNALSESIAIVDKTGLILSCNNSWNLFIHSLGFIETELGADCYFFSPYVDHSNSKWPEQNKIALFIKQLFNNPNDSDSIRFEVTNKEGNNWFNIQLTKFEESGSTRVVIAISDITPLKLSQLETARAAKAANEANVAKTEFLANMSHEIRTPMTAILGFTDLLQDELLSDKESTRAIQTIKNNGDHLLEIINEILDLSKIESGKLEVDLRSCDFLKLLSDVDEVMTLRSIKHEVSYKTTFANPLPTKLKTDSVRLKQILFNLLGNALKFTEHGTIALDIETIQESTGKEFIKFSISDEGIGIEPSKISQLFKPFTQADSSVTRKFGGTGLGLSISKNLAELLGGTIGVDSALGKGSTFWFTIRAVNPTEAETEVVSTLEEYREKQLTAKAKNRRTSGLEANILLAEDGQDNQRLFSFILEKAGANVTLVDNGAKAIAAATNPKNSFDIILMDMQMPEMDGYTATRKLREADYDKPIVALTAHAMASMHERCFHVGCNDVITKPIEKTSFLESIRENIDQYKQSHSPKIKAEC